VLCHGQKAPPPSCYRHKAALAIAQPYGYDEQPRGAATSRKAASPSLFAVQYRGRSERKKSNSELDLDDPRHGASVRFSCEPNGGIMT
jgi:hypothetical protein